jgi:hypothetical protein
MSSANLLSIGEVSRATGKAASAIRYYEEIGLPTLDDCPLFEEDRLPPLSAPRPL